MGSVWNDITATSEPICHVDSGIQTDHPDLKGVMLDSLNFVPTSDDYADYPIDQDTKEAKNVEDACGHGTHTAGIMAAVGNNGLGVSGVAWRAQLYVCRFIWADGTGFLSDAAACLDWCRSKGVKISSNSWGSFSISKTMQEAVKADRAAGSLFVAAAGNDNLNADNKEVYPASLVRTPTFDASHMIVVAAHDALDNIAGFSNYGVLSVHLAAPGVGVLSTVMGSDYDRMDGTSMACPIVAATAALLRARARAFGLTMTMAQLRDTILTSVKVLPSSPRLITKGKLDAKEAFAVLYDLLREKKLMPGTPRRRLPPPSPPPPRYPPPPPPP
ncbi:subtilase, partial [Helicosporidium sp. ATCC 50920]